MIFSEQIARKPDLYPWASKFIDAMWTSHWTPNEFNFQSDLQDFKTKLTDPQREVIIHTLSAIGQIEIAVKKFWAKLGDNLPHPSLTDLGYVMANVEVIHNKAYEKLLEVLNLQSVFEDNLKLDIIQGRVNYLRKYLQKHYKDAKKQYVYSLILFTLFVENVSLFSQFYIVLWFNKFKNVLKDTAQQVQYTKNEELIHAQVGVKIINTIRAEYPELFDAELEEKIISEAKVAFSSECKIIDWMLGDYQSKCLSKPVLKEYVKNRLNESLQQIGFSAIFEIDEELISQTEWMDEICLAPNMTDFFHGRSVDYSKASKVFNEDELF